MTNKIATPANRQGNLNRAITAIEVPPESTTTGSLRTRDANRGLINLAGGMAARARDVDHQMATC